MRDIESRGDSQSTDTRIEVWFLHSVIWIANINKLSTVVDAVCFFILPQREGGSRAFDVDASKIFPTKKMSNGLLSSRFKPAELRENPLILTFC